MLEYSRWHGIWQHWRGWYKYKPLPGGDHTSLKDCLATLEVIRRMAGYKNDQETTKPQP